MSKDDKAIKARDALAKKIKESTGSSSEKAHQMAQKVAQEDARRRGGK